MAEKPAILERFLARNPGGVLKEIGRYVGKTASWRQNPIQVRVFLAAGHQVTGAIITVDQDRDGEYVLLSEGSGQNEVLSFIRISDVVTVQVEATKPLADILKFIQDGGPPSGSPTTRMELRRQVGALSEALKKDSLTVLELDD